MENLSQYILEKTLKADICQPWAEMIANTDSVDAMLAMYVKGIDFCLEKNFPENNDLINLGGDKLEQYGIYVNRVIDYPAGDFLVFLGRCEGSVIANGYAANQIFVKHESVITVKVSENAFVVIDCFESSRLELSAFDNSKVMVNVYGDAKVSHITYDNAVIKVVHKNKRSY